jgi:hypothetical protein
LLSPPAQIEKDFQATVLNTAWKEQKERIRSNAAVHQQDYQQRQADFDRHYQGFVQQFQSQQDEVKQQVESLRAKFASLSAQVQSDMERLEETYLLHDPKRTTGKVCGIVCVVDMNLVSASYVSYFNAAKSAPLLSRTNCCIDLLH